MGRALALAPVALLLTAAVEITAFVLVARAVGAGWAVLAVLVVSFVGLLLLRREGMRAWRRFRATAQAGQPPGTQVTDGVVGLLGALLLAMPGLVTSAVGLLLITPPTRYAARRAVHRAAERRVSAALAGDLFGPRRVRVRRGAPVTDPPVAEPASPAPPAAGADRPAPDVVEGEIVDVRRIQP